MTARAHTDGRLRRHAAAVLAVLAALTAVLAFTSRSHVSFSPVARQRADSFNEVVLQQSGGGQLSFEIGVGLRQEAGAELEDLRIPDRRHVVQKMAFDRDVLSRQVLRLLLRGRVTAADYDPRIPDEAMRSVLSKQKARKMGKWPVYVIGSGATRYVLRTDAASKDVYIVPAEIDARLGPWTGAPLPADEPQRDDGAEIP